MIWGGRDKLVSSAIAPRLVRAIPDSRLVMFGTVGHVCQMEIPVETAREIARHVETATRQDARLTSPDGPGEGPREAAARVRWWPM
ncbi:MAG: hypothetical protein PGN29_18180 [Gordonia paraffinivorans]